MLTMFREASVDGKPGDVSMRRVLAFFFALAAVGLGAQAVATQASSWFAFIPSGLCVGAVLALLFFTTWTDVTALVAAAKGKP